MKRRRAMVVVIAAGMTLSPLAAAAETTNGRPLKQLPHDLINLALAWTEPVKAVVHDTRQFDPVSGLWFGLVDGSVKSVERTVEIFLPPGHEEERPMFKGGKALLRYNF